MNNTETSTSEPDKTQDFVNPEQLLNQLTYLQEWRKDKERAGRIQLFYKLIEFINSEREQGRKFKNKKTTVDLIITDARLLSPRLRDIFFAILSHYEGTSYEPMFEMTRNQMTDLISSGDLEILLSANTNYALKKNRMDARVVGELRGRVALDDNDAKILRKSNEAVSHRSSQDEIKNLEKGEGDVADRICYIAPGYGGYWRTQSFDTYTDGVWTQSNTDFALLASPRSKEGYEGDHRVVMLKFRANEWNRLSIPESYKICGWSIPNGKKIAVKTDQSGDYLFLPDTEEPVTIYITREFYGRKRKNLLSFNENEPQVLNIPADFTPETLEKLAEINERASTNLEKARALVSYAIRRLKYPQKTDFTEAVPSLDLHYATHPNGKIGAIDRVKIADCDTAADYGAALCSALNIPVRLVLGHMVRNRDAQNFCAINSTTGHAWLDIWSPETNSWEEIDFTPAGDPALEEQSDSILDGDFGESQADIPSDNDLAVLEEKLREQIRELEYSEYEEEFSAETNVAKQIARTILLEIERAEATVFENGELVIDVLQQIFSQIVESRSRLYSSYSGPITQAEGGGEISDEYVIQHRLGILAGMSDPRSRLYEKEVVVREEVICGFDVISLHNRSASTERLEGTKKILEEQRKASYLIDAALARVQEKISKSSLSVPLQIRTQDISFLGGTKVVVDKPLSETFTNAEKVELWKSLSYTRAGDADSVGLRYVLKQIRDELGIAVSDQPDEIEVKLKKSNRLKVVFITTDGEPDDAQLVQKHVRELSELGVVVVGIGITRAARTATLLYTNDLGAKGVVLDKLEDLPRVVGEYVVQAAAKLLPVQKRKLIERRLERITGKK